ncbi:ribbon-helix-helix protein, CopG family, partial [Rhodospirillum rubrum]
MVREIGELADRRKLSRSAIVEAAVASFLSPDGADRR